MSLLWLFRTLIVMVTAPVGFKLKLVRAFPPVSSTLFGSDSFFVKAANSSLSSVDRHSTHSLEPIVVQVEEQKKHSTLMVT